jgi:hypothetical protein
VQLNKENVMSTVIATPHPQGASAPRKSVAAWVFTGLLAGAAVLGLSQNARADTAWSVSVAQPGVILTVGSPYPEVYHAPVVHHAPVVYHAPVVMHPHPVTIVRPPHHPPHGVAHGYWRHHKHHRHHRDHGRWEGHDNERREQHRGERHHRGHNHNNFNHPY